jgi:hypothetical protein
MTTGTYLHADYPTPVNSIAPSLDNFFILQKFTWPSETNVGRMKDFATWTSGRFSLAEANGDLLLGQGDTVDFDGIANALDYRKWSYLGDLRQIGLRISGNGKAVLTILDLTQFGAGVIIKEVEIKLAEQACLFDLGDPSYFVGQRLALVIKAKTNLRLRTAEWVSANPAPTAGVIWPSEFERFSDLQKFVWPDASRADRTALYAKWPDGMARLANHLGLPVPQNERVDLVTFFNAISHRKWASLTGIRDLGLRLKGRGLVRVELRCLIALDSSSPVESGAAEVTSISDLEIDPASLLIFSRVIELSDQDTIISLGDPAQIGGAVLGIEALGLSDDALLSEASWITREPPRREVRLAAVITTFKREAAATSAIQRFSSETIPGLPSGALELFVIDNGQSLAIPAPPGVHIIPNRNLGGAGGFTRGLIEAQESGRFTHVLFMDDDASCEPESVWRTAALLARMGNPRASVSGAMLLADEPYIQFEKGARLNLDEKGSVPWTSLLCWRDLSQLQPLVLNDGKDEANYGGWWYFAFPLSAISHLPFPFFVRGDDTDFSINNNLPIVTLNGVASWCDNFGYKLNPSVEYLTWRSWLALAFMHTSSAAQRRSLNAALLYALRLGWRFDYAGMEAVLDGIETSLGGPALFGNEPAPFRALAKVKQRVVSTLLEAADLREILPIYHRASLALRIFTIITLGGHLLPNRFLRSTTRYAPIAWDCRPTSLIRAPAVIYGKAQQLELRQRNSHKFFKGLVRTILLAVATVFRRHAASQLYKRQAATFRSRLYWTQALEIKSEYQREMN